MSTKYDQMAGHVHGKQRQDQNGVNGFCHQEQNGINGMNRQEQPVNTQLGFQAFEAFEEIPQRLETHFFTPNLFNQRFAKIEFPRFYGENPTGWLYKCEGFF